MDVGGGDNQEENTLGVVSVKLQVHSALVGVADVFLLASVTFVYYKFIVGCLNDD